MLSLKNVLFTSRGVSYHFSHAYTMVPVPLDILSLSSLFKILDQRQWMDGFGQSSELDQQFNQRYTCPKSIHSPTSMHESTTSKTQHSRRNTTSHRQGTCIRYCVGLSSASLVSGYEFLLGLIFGSEYGYISMVKRDGWHTREPTLLGEISIARASQVSMSVSIYQKFPCSLSGVILRWEAWYVEDTFRDMYLHYWISIMIQKIH